MVPFPCLRANKNETTHDGGNHPPSHRGLLELMPSIHSNHHRDRGHDEHEGHKGYIEQGLVALDAREVGKNVFGNRPSCFMAKTHETVCRQKSGKRQGIRNQEEPHH